MPNNGHITLCPYYKDEKNNSISCEDTFRSFSNHQKKIEWMDKYCDKDWSLCPYAIELEAMYERINKGADMNLESLKLKAKGLEKELRKLASVHGRDVRKIDTLNRELAQKEAEIQNLVERNHRIEKKYKEFRAQFDKANRDADNWRNYGLHMHDVGITYEGRFCYLISEFAGGIFEDSKYEEWMKEHNYRLDVDHKDEKGRGVYKAVVWEADEKDGKNDKKK